MFCLVYLLCRLVQNEFLTMFFNVPSIVKLKCPVTIIKFSPFCRISPNSQFLDCHIDCKLWQHLITLSRNHIVVKLRYDIHPSLFWETQTFQPIYVASFWINTLKPIQIDHHFPDNIFKHIFLNENCCILVKISLKFVPQGPINNITSLVQIMDWLWSGDKPLSEPMVD